MGGEGVVKGGSAGRTGRAAVGAIYGIYGRKIWKKIYFTRKDSEINF